MTQVTRRTLLRSAAGAGVALSTTGLPAWARVVTRHAGIRQPNSLPFPHLPAGHESMREIKHVVVLMMENHSFDNILGMVPHELPGRTFVDGLRTRRGRFLDVNRDAQGHKYYAQAAASPCQLSGLPRQDWNASHASWDNGRNDGFVKACGPIAMRFWDQQDLPFTYSLARHFPIGERYFCSVLAQTYPNRRFLFTGTASGTIATDSTTFSIKPANGTIFDRLDAHNISWKNYFQNLPSLAIVPGAPTRATNLRPYSEFGTDAAAGKLPQFTFIDPQYDTTSEENPQDIQLGERFVADIVNTLMKAPTWHQTALFITYDEHGGYFDHVPPPRAIPPDSIKPLTKPGDAPGGYDRLGFRVPLIVVSPWARKRYTSSHVQDHTSIDAFIERKWNLPAMTYRDANAHPMVDYFDFGRPAFAQPPRLAAAPDLGAGLQQCHAQGLNPPLTGPGTIDSGYGTGPNGPSSGSEATDVGRLLQKEFRRRGH